MTTPPPPARPIPWWAGCERLYGVRRCSFRVRVTSNCTGKCNLAWNSGRIVREIKIRLLAALESWRPGAPPKYNCSGRESNSQQCKINGNPEKLNKTFSAHRERQKQVAVWRCQDFALSVFQITLCFSLDATLHDIKSCKICITWSHDIS